MRGKRAYASQLLNLDPHALLLGAEPQLALFGVSQLLEQRFNVGLVLLSTHTSTASQLFVRR